MNSRKFTQGFLLIVRDLPIGIDPNYLGSYLNQAGTVLECRVEGTIGFVLVESENSANLIIARLNYSKFNNIPIRIIKYDDTTRRIVADGIGVVIVRGLGQSADISEVHKFFSRVGEVISVQIPRTDWGSLGFAFVQYRDNKTAQKASIELSGFRVDGNPITVNLIKKNGVIVKTNTGGDIKVQQPSRAPIAAHVGDKQQYYNQHRYNTPKVAVHQKDIQIDVSLPKKQHPSGPQISITQSSDTNRRLDIRI
ncbi:hypothetical protein TVAG_478990 [Trichomonas vaginalis G3]|uniref:RRM domain-containing protein n=1 Tax=Trichomonas vaginalis (strain ATCC PRA-98 / G3) TaxID=412133 RepID=A2E015_TRIV3|nr:RNA binding [Trichomonas vaginalis G3]EAY14074.1 hypothetical protein TVAG_478990 [Trichomonas vaginalis G3]KAI5519485.1 RNA binding [Trichomonas vaginalis G3]|eukprot:XP_001326297.1 hypothetical protein [Trichomonas vaginalis G3]